MNDPVSAELQYMTIAILQQKKKECKFKPLLLG